MSLLRRSGLRANKNTTIPTRRRLRDGSSLGYKNWIVSTSFDLEKWAQKRGYDHEGLKYLEAKGSLRKIVVGGKIGADAEWFNRVTGWKRLESRRTGLLGTKIGMRLEMDWWGELHPVTLVHIPYNFVIQVKTDETDGYTALQIGAGLGKLKKLNKAMMGHLAKADVPVPQKIKEFRVTKDAIVPIGTKLVAQHFKPGQFVDVKGVGKGKGFQGAMKRWGFAGGPASHGNSLSHRALGATGQRQSPSKVFKGKKMPGRMGGKPVTIRNLRVMKIDTHDQILFIRGSVPGAKGSWLEITDALWKPHKRAPPFPTFWHNRYLRQPRFLRYRFKDPYKEIREIDWETKAEEMMAALRAAQQAGEAEEEAASSGSAESDLFGED